MKNPTINILKAIACQIIVLHHIFNYGNISENLAANLGGIGDVFFNISRMAVQIFLVIGGYLATQNMLSPSNSKVNLKNTIINRYLRLTVPMIIALTLTIFISYISTIYGGTNFNPSIESIEQVIAHAFLLHSVFDFNSLSAGVWYVAIDFQLYILLGITVYFSNKNENKIKAIIFLMGVASIFIWNLNSNLDVWAIYFIGSYSIGVLAYNYNKNSKIFYLSIIIFSIGLLYEFRGRLLLAIATGLILASNIDKFAFTTIMCKSKFIKKISEVSYSIFLTHFSVIIVFNTFFIGKYNLFESLTIALLILITSNVLGYYFYKIIEINCSKIRLT